MEWVIAFSWINSILVLWNISKVNIKTIKKEVYRDWYGFSSSMDISEAALSRWHSGELSVCLPRASPPPGVKLLTRSPGWSAACLRWSLNTGSWQSFSQLGAGVGSRWRGTRWTPRNTAVRQVVAKETTSRWCLPTGCTWPTPLTLLSPSDSQSIRASSRCPQSVLRYRPVPLLGPFHCSRSHTCWYAWLLSFCIARLPYHGLHNYATESPRHWDSDRRMSSQNRSSFVDNSTARWSSVLFVAFYCVTG